MKSPKMVYVLLLTLINAFQACSENPKAVLEKPAVQTSTPHESVNEKSDSATVSAADLGKPATPQPDLSKSQKPKPTATQRKKKVDFVEKTEHPIASETNQVTETASPTTPVQTAKPVEAQFPDHAQWSSLLSKYVSIDGEVNYKALKQEQNQVEAYLETLSAQVPTSDWPRNEAMAYWINAYNAATILLILQNYPLKSIQDLDQGKPWDVKRIKLGGKMYSLNQIENDILRPRYKDARIHFAVNCAAKGCPPLHREAFEPARLDQQLTTRTVQFLKNKRYNQIDESGVRLSKIFDWYSSDFGNLSTFFQKYISKSFSPDAKISFNDYDWTLNGK